MGDEFNISIDFKRDWAQLSRQRLEAAGYSIDEDDGPEDVCIKYLNALKQRISRRPRNVVAPTEFTWPPLHDIRQLRRSGVNTLVQVSDGTVYGSVGGGNTPSGLSADVIREYKSYVYFFYECEVYIKNNIQELVEIARQQHVEMCPPFSFRLDLDNDKAYAIEMNSRIRFLVGNTRV